jgi:hypothetical protein
MVLGIFLKKHVFLINKSLTFIKVHCHVNKLLVLKLIMMTEFSFRLHTLHLP